MDEQGDYHDGDPSNQHLVTPPPTPCRPWTEGTVLTSLSFTGSRKSPFYLLPSETCVTGPGVVIDRNVVTHTAVIVIFLQIEYENFTKTSPTHSRISTDFFFNLMISYINRKQNNNYKKKKLLVVFSNTILSDKMCKFTFKNTF